MQVRCGNCHGSRIIVISQGWFIACTRCNGTGWVTIKRPSK